MGQASSNLSPIPRQPLVMRFATGIGLVTLAALGAVAPATVRVSAMAPHDTVALWAALACIALGPMMAVVLALRVSEQSIRQVLRGHAALRIFVVGQSFVGLFVALTVIGSVLRATTHNHVLAGVTFAWSALVAAFLVALSGVRLVTLLEATGRWKRWLAVTGLTVFTLAAAAWIVSRVLQAPTNDPATLGASATLIDVPLFAVCAVVVSQRAVAELPGLSLLALVGLPLAVAVISVGSPMLREGWVRTTLTQRAPAFASAITLATSLQLGPCARATCQ